jgi:hypothetical protein
MLYKMEQKGQMCLTVLQMHTENASTANGALHNALYKIMHVPYWAWKADEWSGCPFQLLFTKRKKNT